MSVDQHIRDRIRDYLTEPFDPDLDRDATTARLHELTTALRGVLELIDDAIPDTPDVVRFLAESMQLVIACCLDLLPAAEVPQLMADFAARHHITPGATP